MNTFLETKKNELIEMSKGCEGEAGGFLPDSVRRERIFKKKEYGYCYNCGDKKGKKIVYCPICQTKLSTTIQSDLSWAKYALHNLTDYDNPERDELQKFIKWMEGLK